MANEQALLMKGIYKSFPGVKALQNVDLELEKGDILALLGENGAGKSTLIKILSGAYHADQGEIFFEGKKVSISDPRDSIRMGVNVIYQELNSADHLTIAENIFMGNLPYKAGGKLVDYQKLKENTAVLLARVGLNRYDPFTPVSSLSIAEKQMVEIAKALSKKMKILVMDEPTAALNAEEIIILFSLIKQLAEEGTAIIYISHRLDEVFEISNKVQVMRDGKSIQSLRTVETCKRELIALMVGREITEMYPSRDGRCIGETVLEVNKLSSEYVQDISFHVRSGEIVGLFGLMGAGRTETVEMIFGARKRKSGTIKICGQVADIRSPKDAKKYGIGYVPSDRKGSGLFLLHSVGVNISANVIQKICSRIRLLNFKKESRLVSQWIERLGIKTPGKETPVDSLSGGNQQKVVVAKWLAAEPKVLILNEPTRGVDVGAKSELYNLINDLSRQGIAFIMVSSELPEVIAMSDRIVVLHEGRLKGELQRCEFTQEKLLETAIGGEDDE